jgi:hypothetical protein
MLLTRGPIGTYVACMWLSFGSLLTQYTRSARFVLLRPLSNKLDV